MNKLDAQFRSATPILPVRNVRETASFYQDKLGFTVEYLGEDPHYASVVRGGAAIDFGEGRPRHVGSGVCFIHVDDVDALYRDYASLDLELVGDLADRDYGSRDFRVRDNNGNLLIFGRPLD